MKVDIRDPATLRRLRPLDIAMYLRAGGWHPQDSTPRASLWRSPGDADAEVLVPNDRSLADFAARMADLIHGISIVEGRSQLEILSDLTVAGHDVIRVRVGIEDARDGTIAIDSGTELIANARDMLLAAAAATVERRSYFPTRKPAMAVEYMSRVRLGQTELGSYVVTLLSPISPSLRQGQQELELSEPFERRVTVTLADSLGALRDATADAAATGAFQGFEAAIELGVTANLCSAVAGMAERLGNAADLEVRVSWSPARPVRRPLQGTVRFGTDVAPIIREAARIIREAAPVDDYQVVGLVTRLDRRPDASEGQIQVLTVEEAAARSIRVTLGADDYGLAIRAHEEHLPISVIGQLRRQGPFSVLEAPHDFAILRDL